MDNLDEFEDDEPDESELDESEDKISVVLFFVLSYIIFWILGYFFNNFLGNILYGEYHVVLKILVYILVLIPGAAPFISALVVTGISEGKKGVRIFFRHMLKVKVGFFWYLAVIVIPLCAYVIPKLILLLMGNSVEEVFTDNISTKVSWFVIFGLCIAGFQEEPGWRGFAVPKLNQKFNPAITSIIIGVFWAFWHLNFYWLGERSLDSFPVFLFLVVVLSFIYTWIYINTESILLAIIFHSAHNVCAGIFKDFPGTLYVALTYLLILIIISIGYGIKKFRISSNTMNK